MSDIRLACMVCDRTDFDGIDQLPADWEGVAEADVSIAQDAGAWWTHLGWCPDCKEPAPVFVSAVAMEGAT